MFSWIRFKKSIICLTLILCSLFCTFFYDIKKVEAGAVVYPIEKILGMVLTTCGALNIASGGRVTSLGGEITDSVRNVIANNMGTGIYTNADGSYSFTPECTQDIYNALMGNSSLDARVCSDFDGLTPTGGLHYSGNPAFNFDFNEARGLYSYYLMALYPEFPGDIQSGWTNKYLKVFDLYNVAYIYVTTISSRQCVIYFYDGSGNIISVPYTSYTSNLNGLFKNNGNTNSIVVDEFFPRYCSDNDYSNNDVVTAFYNLFPLRYKGENGGGTIFWSNRSIIISKKAGVPSLVNQTNGVVVNNNFYQFPTVSNEVIENNDWTQIYNNYITNVVSNYYFEMTGDKDEKPETNDLSKLRKWMKIYSGEVVDAIEEGSENIVDRVNVTNEWLTHIYQLLNMIYSKLDDLQGGGTDANGCVWSALDVQHLLSALNRIDTNMADTEENMASIYSLLNDIYDTLTATSNQPNAPNSVNDYNWYVFITGLPNVDALDLLDKLDNLTDILKSSVPLCYILAGGAVLNAVGVDPVEPSFSIPFTVTSLNYDEDFNLDLSVFDDLRTIVNALLCLAFIFFLIWLTFELLFKVFNILG